MATMDDDELSLIAAAQRRELMDSQLIESDLDFAFHLQLQEAITASLSFQPSTSSSPPPPQQQQRSQFLVLPLSNEKFTFPNFADLQTLELEKFRREVHDRALIEDETKRVQSNLHRRIHDQKLAREILHMPEDEWQQLGDHFERPYGEGSSNSSKSSDEVFRVYYKGLMEEERNVTLAGIGVAICDSRDELIFEMRKPAAVGDRVSRQTVEGKALIEALNAAAALDLKRIVFYCDYYTMYQFITGRWQPKQRKIATFVNQVNLLRKKFTYCVPSLVARNDVKFAFKLAREAIVSHINKRVESNEAKLETCVICLEDTYAGQFFSVDGCSHRYCFSCMKQHVEVKLLHGMVPKCPHEGCNIELRIESCEKFLTPKLLEMMKQRLKEASIPVTEKIYCPYPKCSALMSKTEALENSHNFFIGAEISGIRRCIKCGGDFCIYCNVPWHKNMTCTEYRWRNPIPLVEDAKLKNLAARNLWRQCVKCKHMIELAAGCYHMTCRCGYEFCYTCGAECKDKKTTCTCPLWNEENIIHDEYDNDDDEGEFYVGRYDDGNDYGFYESSDSDDY